METFILGAAMFFNFAIIKHKFEHRQYASAIVDAGLYFILVMYFSGTSYMGTAATSVASAMFSLYLLRYPPRMFNN